MVVFSEILTIWNEPLVPGLHLRVFRDVGRVIQIHPDISEDDVRDNVFYICC